MSTLGETWLEEDGEDRGRSQRQEAAWPHKGQHFKEVKRDGVV